MPDTLRTPLHARHLALNARMVPFAGWDMPIQYQGIIAEHQAVRSAWGMFDVSHMGRLSLKGPQAGALLDRLLTCDVAGLQEGQARYGLMCLPEGGILDDVVVLRLADRDYLLVCNASSRVAVVAWLLEHRGRQAVDINDRTAGTVMVAVQGPDAREHANSVLGGRVPPLRRFQGASVDMPDGRALVTRTGYTGEDGYEIIVEAAAGPLLWDRLAGSGATPCGLGARDTLRLEAGLPLHGQDIDRTTNPLEAGLDRFVKLEGAEFVGKPALLAARAQGLGRRLAGFRSLERGGIPRHEQAICLGGQPVGKVTSGSFAPSLGVNIGLGYVPAAVAAPGQRLEIDVRGRMVPVDVVRLPFYRRQPAVVMEKKAS